MDSSINRIRTATMETFAAVALAGAAIAGLMDSGDTRAAERLEASQTQFGAARMQTVGSGRTELHTEYGKDGSKGGNVEFEWKVEEGES